MQQNYDTSTPEGKREVIDGYREAKRLENTSFATKTSYNEAECHESHRFATKSPRFEAKQQSVAAMDGP